VEGEGARRADLVYGQQEVRFYQQKAAPIRSRSDSDADSLGSIEEWDELGAARSGKRPTPSLSSVMGYSGGGSSNRVQQHQRSNAATEAHSSAIADDAGVETGGGAGGGRGGGGIRWDEENLKANEGVMAQTGADVIGEAKTPWQRSPADSEASSQARHHSCRAAPRILLHAAPSACVLDCR
jgi:hypothetical protein